MKLLNERMIYMNINKRNALISKIEKETGIQAGLTEKVLKALKLDKKIKDGLKKILPNILKDVVPKENLSKIIDLIVDEVLDLLP